MDRCRIVSSWPLSGGFGSGTETAANGIIEALRRRKVLVDTLSYKGPTGNYFFTTARRLWYGYAAGSAIESYPFAPTIAIDQDGAFFPRGFHFACLMQALYGDVVRFESGLNRALTAALGRLEARAGRKAHTVFVASSYTADRAMELYGIPSAKLRILNNGIFFEEWRAALEAAPARADGRPTVLCVARLYRRKNVDKLMIAWPRVLQKVPDARLVIVGDGLEYAALIKLARERGMTGCITFAGHVPPGAPLAPYYKMADVFCLPSMQENFGIVLLEAMAAGLPVAAMAASAVPEVVEDGVQGLLAPPDDFEGLADRVAELLLDAAARKRMGEAGITRVDTRFRWERSVTPLLDWVRAW